MLPILQEPGAAGMILTGALPISAGLFVLSACFALTSAEPRVEPPHARRMTAMLQNAITSGRPVLLLYDSKSGHSSSLSIAADVEQTSHELAFLLWQLGWTH